MRRAAAGLALALAALLVLLLARAASFESRQLRVEPAPPPRTPVAADTAARHLGASIAFRTISPQDPALRDEAAFRALHRYLERTYPRFHAVAGRETAGGLSLLYTWPGRDPSLAPVLLLAHQDVVPIEESTRDDWIHPPFAGRIADGFVWGRGAIDDKSNLIAILEAAEALAREGFRPRRGVYLAFGHDEELGGERGAAAIAALLEERGVRLEWVLDEGGAIVADALPLPDFERLLAMVGIAEKGSTTVELTVEAEGGHSSTPPPQTAVGVVAAAVQRIESSPLSARIGDTTRLTFAYLGPELPLAARLVLANLWLSGPLLERFAGEVPMFNALVRTTTAATVIEGGIKSNVLPERARALVNHRILPGDTMASVMEHDRRAVDDERVAFARAPQVSHREPSPVSRIDTPAFEMLQRTLGEIFPRIVVAPFLVIAGTDARHFYRVSDNVYRISPFVFRRDDLRRVHGTNERLAVADLATGVRFYRRLLENGTR